EVLGEDAAGRLAADPWLLLAVPGVRPQQADGFARAVLGPECGPGDVRRSLAVLGWLLAQAEVKGHTALDAPLLHKALAQYGVPDPEAALEEAIGEGTVLVFQEALGEPAAEGGAAEESEKAEEAEEAEERAVRVLVGRETAALAEESLADGLARIVNTCPGPDQDGRGADWEQAVAAAPSRSAGELVRAAAGHGLVVHTGGEA
ncbi:DNA helicase RecD, partial [Streptomyces bambusae]|nr:DNA helicase RecD [Streptomyces bambusae]